MSRPLHQVRGGALPAAQLIERIGNTPLIRLEGPSRVYPDTLILGKAEWHNPGGSVKDRAAWYMIRDGERSGRLTRAKTIIDATSGNTGIAYAWIGAARGYRVRLAVPGNASPERKRLLAAYGADVIYTDPLSGIDGALETVQELIAAEPGRYFYPDQYKNPANWKAHYDTTAPEIWEQTAGTVTHFVAGLGTSGTFVGTARGLKRIAPHVQCVSFEPDGPFHGLEGLKHMTSSRVPGIYDAALADLHLNIRTEDAYEMARRLAREDGLLVGPSAAAAVAAALEVAARLDGKAATIVVVLPDNGEKYSSDRFWQEERA